jgi:hypothetical protein
MIPIADSAAKHPSVWPHPSHRRTPASAKCLNTGKTR